MPKENNIYLLFISIVNGTGISYIFCWLFLLIKVVKKLAVASKKAMNATGITIQQFSEADGGQEVFHLHFHIIPRYEGKPMDSPGLMVKDMSVLSLQANKIKAELGSS